MTSDYRMAVAATTMLSAAASRTGSVDDILLVSATGLSLKLVHIPLYRRRLVAGDFVAGVDDHL